MTLTINKLQELVEQYKINEATIEINGRFSIFLKDDKDNIYYERHNYND